MFLTGESRLEWDYSIERAELDGYRWQKSLKDIKRQVIKFIVLLVGELGLIFSAIVLTAALSPEPFGTPSFLVFLLELAVFSVVFGGGPPWFLHYQERKIAKHREKTMALWVVQFGSVPDYVLLLWQFFGQPELSWNFVPSEEAYGWLSRYLGDGYILLAKGESKPLSVLAFLKEWKNSPAAAKIAEALDEDLAPVPEECRQTLYWTEFWQRFKEEG